MVKSGSKSTEFYVTLIAMSVGMLNHMFGLDLTADSQLIVGGIAAAYALGRSIVKAAAAYFGGAE